MKRCFLPLLTLALFIGAWVQLGHHADLDDEVRSFGPNFDTVKSQDITLSPQQPPAQRNEIENSALQPMPSTSLQTSVLDTRLIAAVNGKTDAVPQLGDSAQHKEQVRPLFELATDMALSPLTEIDLRERRSILSRSVIRVDWAALEAVKEAVKTHGTGVLEIPTKEKGRLAATIGRVITNWGGGYTLSGQLDDYPDGTFMATAHGDALVASLRTGEGKGSDFDIVLSPEGIQEIRRVDVSALPGCSGTPEPKAPAKALRYALSPAIQKGAEVPVTSEASASTEDMTVIDIMVVYTAAARDKFGTTSGTLAAINQAINGANQAFTVSEVSAMYRLAHAQQISYRETNDSFLDLDRVSYLGDDHLDEVHGLRDTHGADLVSLWTGTNYGGVAMMMGELSVASEFAAFSVCGATSSISNMTLLFTHECGHNLGCNHELANAGGPGLFPYSYGWSWTGSNGSRYRSVMAYESGQQVLRFSNPNVNHAGVPSGTANADNARTINNSKDTVSSFREDRFISPNYRNVPAAGGGFSFAVTNLESWSWGQSAGSAWVSSAEPADQNGDQTFSYSVAPNPSTLSRSAKITLTSGSTRSSHLILQEGADHGDTPATATPIAPDSTTLGKIEKDGDVDYFRIDVAGPGLLSVRTTGWFNTRGELLSAAGALLTEDDDSGDWGMNFQMFHVVEAGTYYVRVDTPWFWEPGKYELVSSFTPSVTLAVTRDFAMFAASGGSRSFQVTALGNWSWSVSGGEGWLGAAAPASQSGTQTFIYTVAANAGATPRSALLTFTNGTFTARHLILQQGPDQGETLATAHPIEPNSLTASSMKAADDKDYFRIDITRPGTLTLGTSHSIFNSEGILLSSAGTPLDAIYNRKDYGFLITREVKPGTYFLSVSSFDKYEDWDEFPGEYLLVSEFTPSHMLLSLTREVPAAQAATPDKAGTLALSASPSKNATRLAPVSTPQTQMFAVTPNTPVKATATARAGHLFSHWSGLSAGAQRMGATLSFIMPKEDVLGLTAHFISNPFIAAGGANPFPGLGTKPAFQGLLMPDAGTPADNATVGHLSATLVAATGAVSGKVLLDGKATSFTGVLHGDGSVWFKVGRSFSASLPLANGSLTGKTLTAAWSATGLSATVQSPGAKVSTGLARPKVAATPAALLNAANAKSGYLTLVLPSKTQTPVKPADSYPQGTGHAALTLATAGTLKLAGVLADGTRVTASSVLVTGEQSPLFIPLTTPGAASSVKGGSLSGSLVFDPAAEDSDAGGTDWLWFRPLAVSAATKAQSYRQGWPDGIVLDPVGALYQRATAVQTALGIGIVEPVSGNAELVFAGGKLAGEVRVGGFNIEGNRVIKINTADRSFSLILNATTGLIQGSFTPNWPNAGTKLPAFQGMLLQKGENRGGWGFFLSNAVGDTSSESGRVSLDSP
jgi:hypothetical protein